MTCACGATLPPGMETCASCGRTREPRRHLLPRSAWSNEAELQQRIEKASERLGEEEQAHARTVGVGLGQGGRHHHPGGRSLAVGGHLGCSLSPGPEAAPARAASPAASADAKRPVPRPSSSPSRIVPLPPYGVAPPPSPSPEPSSHQAEAPGCPSDERRDG